jgi:HK97 family phage prohead protease
MTTFEIRTAAPLIERRGKNGGRTIFGYAAVFNAPTDIAGQFTEQIAPGAFAESLARDDVRALYNHDGALLLGRTKAGTVRLSEDSHGLITEIDVPNTTVGNDLVTLMERGDITGASFGFIVRDEAWFDAPDLPLRILNRVDLLEVSLVATPAYEQTTMAVRFKAFCAAAAAVRMRMKLAARLRGMKV